MVKHTLFSTFVFLTFLNVLKHLDSLTKRLKIIKGVIIKGSKSNAGNLIGKRKRSQG